MNEEINKATNTENIRMCAVNPNVSAKMAEYVKEVKECGKEIALKLVVKDVGTIVFFEGIVPKDRIAGILIKWHLGEMQKARGGIEPMKIIDNVYRINFNLSEYSKEGYQGTLSINDFYTSERAEYQLPYEDYTHVIIQCRVAFPKELKECGRNRK